MTDPNRVGGLPVGEPGPQPALELLVAKGSHGVAAAGLDQLAGLGMPLDIDIENAAVLVEPNRHRRNPVHAAGIRPRGA